MKMNTQIRCVVKDTNFSVAMLLTRLLSAGAVLYFCIGIMLNFRTFAENYSIISSYTIPSAVVVAICIVAAAACLCLLLGLYTRSACWFIIIFNIFNGFMFTGGQINMIFIFFILLSFAALSTLLILGPGRYSLDFKKAVNESIDFLTK